jgi:membrane protease YdiL (CAAX protease family)
MSFTLRITLVFAVAVAAAAAISPFAAALVAAAGFHFPFPRIFDRTVMVTLGVAIIVEARRLKAGPLLRRGFEHPLGNLARLGRGFLVAAAAMAILVTVAVSLGAHPSVAAGVIWRHVPKYVLAAFTIALIEEGFFRAFLLAGMQAEMGRGAAVVTSSAIYAAAHLVRAPAHFYLSGIHPVAGIENVGASLHNLAHPALAFPAFFGLFLLGIVLAEAFLETGNAYFPMGLHAGFVIGAKLWPKMTAAGARLPEWFEGWGPIPLISGAAAWLMALVLLALIRPLSSGRRASS